jgi:hypothetical protein
LTDSLSIGGSANVVPNFDEIVIIDVTEVSKTSGLSESSRPVITTSVQSDFSGSAGQSVVYKITAHNYSETDTYVYTGMYCDNNAFPIANKLNISASTDDGNTKVLPNNINSTCSKGTPIAPGEDFVFYVTYTLTAKWDNVYLIIFVDSDGTVIYQESFTDTSKKNGLSAEGQAIVNQKLAELAEIAAKKNMSVAWSDYDIKTATSDITVRAVYNYAGYLDLEPVYLNDEKLVIIAYKVKPVDNLSEYIADTGIVEVPGDVGGLPVIQIDRITNIKGSNDWDNFEKTITTIIIDEGVEVLAPNSLAYTPNLNTVYLPKSIQKMGKNTFSRNIALGGFGRGDDKKVLTIEYAGTMEEWKAVNAASEQYITESGDDGTWYGGLKEGSIVRCSDGGYFKLEKGIGPFASLKWVEYPPT